MSKPIKYYVYCRKSTEEWKSQQIQSIPAQVKMCLKYVRENKDIEIAPLPKDSTIREKLRDESELMRVFGHTKEDMKLYEEIKDLAVIIEQKSAKTPWDRVRRTELMRGIKKWWIKWLLSYSPDRQARNLLEWWELIDYVDQWIVTLKYSNFHFDPNASGKMMLGIRFVFSKQYSDKLSEDVGKWNAHAVHNGKAMWKYKHWYIINEQWYHEPHTEYFPLMKEAFRKKYEERQSDKVIANRLTKNWFLRPYKGNMVPMNPKSLYKVWTDPFFYGINTYWMLTCDLTVHNSYFTPLITIREHNLLLWYSKRLSSKTLRKKKDEKRAYIPFVPWLVVTKEWRAMTDYLPNPKRYRDKLTILKRTKPNADLWDVVKMHQIYYADKAKESETTWLSITADKLDNKIKEALSKFKVNETEREEYVEFQKQELGAYQHRRDTKRTELTLKQNNMQSQYDEYVRKNTFTKRDEHEEKIYQDQKKLYEAYIDEIDKQKEALKASDRDHILELEAFMWLFRETVNFYGRASLVQKRKLIQLLFLNIIVSDDLSLELVPNPVMKHLFVWITWGARTRT